MHPLWESTQCMFVLTPQTKEPDGDTPLHPGRVFLAFLTNMLLTGQHLDKCHLPYDLPWDVTAVTQGGLRL